MIELIILSKKENRDNRFITRLKKIKSWVTLELDMENTQHIFKAREDFGIDPLDGRFPIVIFKLQFQDSLIIDAMGGDLPSPYQISIKIKEMFAELLKIVVEKAEKLGYKNGWNESERLHVEQ